jgi:hypothetical protein
MPRCVGTYSASDKECNGNKQGATDDERSACVYRDRCVALKELAEREKRPLEQYVVLRVVGRDSFAFALDEDLLPKVQKTIADFRISGGMAAARRRNRPLAVVAPKPTKVEATVLARDMADWIFARLAKKLVAGKSERRRQRALAVSDRSKTSGYKSLYLRTKKGPRALMSVYAKVSRNMAEVRIAENFEAFVSSLPASEFNLLSPIDYTGKDGAFKIKIVNVDLRRAGIIVDRFAALLLGHL